MASAFSPLSPTSAAARNYARAAVSGDADVDFCASQAVAAPDVFQCSQPAAPAATPVARFVQVADAAVAAGAVAPFELCCSAGAQLQLGRVVPESALPIGMTVIFLTPRHDIGISRNQGVLRFDGKSIVLEPIKREGFPTFLNGVLVDTPQSLAHSDVLGFGGVGSTPSADTVLVRADLAALGVPSRMAPPPPKPPPSAAASAGVEAADGRMDTEAAVGAKRGRGERGGLGRKKQSCIDGAAAPSAEPTAATIVSAEDAVRQERAAMVEGLSGEPRRFALLAFEQVANARGRLRDAVEDGRGGDAQATLCALGRVVRGASGWLRGLADDMERAAQRIGCDRELARELHTQHDARQGQHGSAATHGERHVHIESSGGKSGGGKGRRGGKGGSGKGCGGKGGDGKGGGKGKGGRRSVGKGGRGRY